MTDKTNSFAHESSKARAEPLETLAAVVPCDSMVTGQQGLPVLGGLTGILKVKFVAPHFDARYPVKYGFESDLVSYVAPKEFRG